MALLDAIFGTNKTISPIPETPKPTWMDKIKDAISSFTNPEPIKIVFNQPAQATASAQVLGEQTPQPFQYDLTKSGITIPEGYTFVPPTGALDLAIQQTFPDEATKAATVALSENMASPYNAEGYNFNAGANTTPGFEGSGDYGPWQINNFTMQDYIKRMPTIMQAMGISTVEDLKDPVKSTKFAKLIRDYQGWKAWKGWQNKGISGI